MPTPSKRNSSISCKDIPSCTQMRAVPTWRQECAPGSRRPVVNPIILNESSEKVVYLEVGDRQAMRLPTQTMTSRLNCLKANGDLRIKTERLAERLRSGLSKSNLRQHLFAAELPKNQNSGHVQAKQSINAAGPHVSQCPFLHSPARPVVQSGREHRPCAARGVAYGPSVSLGIHFCSLQ